MENYWVGKLFAYRTTSKEKSIFEHCSNQIVYIGPLIDWHLSIECILHISVMNLCTSRIETYAVCKISKSLKSLIVNALIHFWM